VQDSFGSLEAARQYIQVIKEANKKKLTPQPTNDIPQTDDQKATMVERLMAAFKDTSYVVDRPEWDEEERKYKGPNASIFHTRRRNPLEVNAYAWEALNEAIHAQCGTRPSHRQYADLDPEWYSCFWHRWYNICVTVQRSKAAAEAMIKSTEARMDLVYAPRTLLKKRIENNRSNFNKTNTYRAGRGRAPMPEPDPNEFPEYHIPSAGKEHNPHQYPEGKYGKDRYESNKPDRSKRRASDAEMDDETNTQTRKRARSNQVSATQASTSQVQQPHQQSQLILDPQRLDLQQPSQQQHAQPGNSQSTSRIQFRQSLGQQSFTDSGVALDSSTNHGYSLRPSPRRSLRGQDESIPGRRSPPSRSRHGQAQRKRNPSSKAPRAAPAQDDSLQDNDHVDLSSGFPAIGAPQRRQSGLAPHSDTNQTPQTQTRGSGPRPEPQNPGRTRALLDRERARERQLADLDPSYSPFADPVNGGQGYLGQSHMNRQVAPAVAQQGPASYGYEHHGAASGMSATGTTSAEWESGVISPKTQPEGDLAIADFGREETPDPLYDPDTITDWITWTIANPDLLRNRGSADGTTETLSTDATNALWEEFLEQRRNGQLGLPGTQVELQHTPPSTRPASMRRGESVSPMSRLLQSVRSSPPRPERVATGGGEIGQAGGADISQTCLPAGQEANAEVGHGDDSLVANTAFVEDPDSREQPTDQGDDEVYRILQWYVTSPATAHLGPFSELSDELKMKVWDIYEIEKSAGRA